MQLYLDACILIYLLDSHPRLKAPISAALRARRGALLCWTEISRLETLVKPVRENCRTICERYEHFFASPAARQLLFARRTFDQAIDLRATHGLKTPDALHLAAAIDAGCSEFWTNDRRLNKAAAGRIAIVTFS